MCSRDLTFLRKITNWQDFFRPLSFPHHLDRRQVAWPTAAGASSRPPQEPRPSTAAPPAQAPPSFHPAASCSRRRGYATACRTSCRRAAAACWRISGTTATPTCSCGTSPATSWSSARTNTAAGESPAAAGHQIQLFPSFEHLRATLDILLLAASFSLCGRAA